MLYFLRALINKKYIKERAGNATLQGKQTNLEISKRGVLSLMLFFMVINGVLGELENVMVNLLFADNLVIFTNTRILTTGILQVTKKQT